jgi:protein TonB
VSEPPRNPPQVETQRARRRQPATGLPVGRERGWVSSFASLLIHAFIIVLLILPSIRHNLLVIDEQGAGGPGPAGGGGGGNRGTGGVKSERIQFVVATEVAPVPVPPRIIPPLIEKKPEEVVPPPVPTPPVTAAKSDSAKATEATAPIPGVGGGTGNDGSGGTGSGSGGGMGSGKGTGKGSGEGPGTGGGMGTVYPPTVTQLVILPMPVPGKVKPYEMEAVFDVDSTGHATLVQWNQPKDNNYAKKVLETLLGYRFRPAVRAADGMSVRGYAVIRASAR